MARGPSRRLLSAARLFEQAGRDATISQAMALLRLGARLRGDDRAPSSRRRAAGRGPTDPNRGLVPSSIPRVRSDGRRIGADEALSRLRASLRAAPPDRGEPGADPAAIRAALPALVRRLARERTPEDAAALLEACLRHPERLIRVAAADAYFDLTADPARALAILREGTRGEDDLARELAAKALSRLQPTDPRLAELTHAEGVDAFEAEAPGLPSSADREGGRPAGLRAAAPRPALLIHGTFPGLFPAWYAPGGDFHTYIRAEVRPGVYGASDYFRWSGADSHGARVAAAQQLVAWAERRRLAGLDLLGHSHGANVAILATRLGLRVGALVLMSCPVHRDRYMPDFSAVDRVVSVRLTADPVIELDGGAQRFGDPRIRELLLPAAVRDHQATRFPASWRRERWPSRLGLVATSTT